jgi:hypothetical protein
MTEQTQNTEVAQAAAKAQVVETEAKKATESKATKEKKVAEPKPVVVKDTKNGVTRPGKDTDTGRVWAICDTLNASATDEDPISRAKVIKHAEAKGLNPSTAATQYGRWRTYNGLARETSKAVKPAAAEAQVEQAQPKGEAKPQVEQGAEGAGFSLDPK